MSPIFDKSRLLTDEFAPYRYTLTRRAKGRRVEFQDLTLSGYLVALGDNLGKITCDVAQCQRFPDDNNMWVLMKVTVYLNDMVTSVSDVGEANLFELESKGQADSVGRIAYSRALKRAIARLLGIRHEDLNPGIETGMDDIDSPISPTELGGGEKAKPRSLLDKIKPQADSGDVKTEGGVDEW